MFPRYTASSCASSATISAISTYASRNQFACATIYGKVTALSHGLTLTIPSDSLKTNVPGTTCRSTNDARMAGTGRYRNQNPLRVTRIEALASAYALRLNVKMQLYRHKEVPAIKSIQYASQMNLELYEVTSVIRLVDRNDR